MFVLVILLVFLLNVNINITQAETTSDGIDEDAETDLFNNVGIQHYLHEKIFQHTNNTSNGNFIDFDNQSSLVDEIIRLFGNDGSLHGSGDVCLLGEEHDMLLPEYSIHCFNKSEISNITVAIYKCCFARDATGPLNVKILRGIVEEIDRFQRTDYTLLWKCFEKLPRNIDGEFTAIVGKILQHPFANYSLYNVLVNMKLGRPIFRTNFTIVNSDLVLSIWHPFVDNITGIALYEDRNATNPFWILHIYANQTSDDVDLENLKMAGYVPNNFLNKLIENSTINKEHLYVIMVMIMNGTKYNGALEVSEHLENYIGISIPRFCKNNTEPLLKAFFEDPTNDTQKEWMYFGQDYSDSLQKYNWYRCSLSELSYFGRYPPDTQDKPAKVMPACERNDYDLPMESFFNRTFSGRILDDINKKIQNLTELLYGEVLSKVLEAFAEEDDPDAVFEKELENGFSDLKVGVESINRWFDEQIAGKLENELGNLRELAKNKGDWILHEWKRCFLNALITQFSFTEGAPYFETAKEAYCIEEYDEDTGVKYKQTPVFYFVFPEKFCLDRDLQLPSQFCYSRGLFSESFDEMAVYSECYDNHPVSSKTANLYQLLIDCEYHAGLCRSAPFSPASLIEEAENYVDIVMVLRILYNNSTESVEPFLDAIEKGLRLLEVQAKGKRQMSYISAFLRYFTFYKSYDVHAGYVVTDSFIYLAFNPFEINVIGLVLYKQGNSFFRDYIVKPLLRENATRVYSEDEDVEVVIYLNCDECNMSNQTGSLIDVFIIYNNNLTESDQYRRRSRLVGLYKDRKMPTLNFTVFLKPVDGQQPKEGQWSTVSLSNSTLTTISIVEPQNDVCDSSSKFSIFSVYLDKKLNNSENIGSSKKKRSGFLSQLVVSVNIETQEIHNKHSQILNTIMLYLAVLSAVSLVFIFITLLALKGWYKKRFYSVQLAIAVACETVFFILDDRHINHIGYIVFYYSMLAQFAWMVIIGYIQYMKFVQIFKFSELGLWKSLLSGWFIPFLITLASVLSNMECLKCKLCSKNGNTFTYFVVIPVCVVILCNLIIYVVVMVNVCRMKTSMFGPEARRAWLRAVIILPFVMGISWIFILAFMTRLSWVNLLGSYLFHIIAPSQGLVLFVFVVVLDQDTRKRWWNLFWCGKEMNFSSQMTSVANT